MTTENFSTDLNNGLTFSKNPTPRLETVSNSTKGIDQKSKKTISNMFDDAVKSVNDISDLIPAPNEIPAQTMGMGMEKMQNPAPVPNTMGGMQYMSPFMMFNPAMKMQSAQNMGQQFMPNEMMYMNMLAHFSQYQGLMQQLQQQNSQIPMNTQTLTAMVPPNMPPKNEMPMSNMSPAMPMKTLSNNNFTLGASNMPSAIEQPMKSPAPRENSRPSIQKSRYPEPMPENMPEPLKTEPVHEEFLNEPISKEDIPKPMTQKEPLKFDDIPIKTRNMPEMPEIPEKKISSTYRKNSSSTIEELPIKTTNKTFEQLLEENLKHGPSKIIEAPQERPSKVSKPNEKKQFLKRKSSKIQPSANSKKYTYFTDKFSTDSQPTLADALNLNDFSKNPTEISEPKKTTSRKKNQGNFLTKGKGTGGGITGTGGKNKKKQCESEEKDKEEVKKAKTCDEEIEEIDSKIDGNNDVRNSMAEFQKLEEECNKSKKTNSNKKSEILREEINEIGDNEKPIENQENSTDKKKSKFSEPSEILKNEENEQIEGESVAKNQAVKEKLKELSDEIEKMKKDRKRMDKQKSEYDKLFKKLQDDVSEFELYKEREIASINEIKEKEVKKIASEKRVMERQTKAMQNISNKKEKEEIETLKKENSKLHEDLKAKDGRYKVLLEKAKKQLDEQISKNKELESLVSELKSQIVELKNSNSNSDNIVKTESRKIFNNKENKPKEEENVGSGKKVKSGRKMENSIKEQSKEIMKKEVKEQVRMATVLENPKDNESEISDCDVGNEYDNIERPSNKKEAYSNAKQKSENDELSDMEKQEKSDEENNNERPMKVSAKKSEPVEKQEIMKSEENDDKDTDKYDIVFLPKYHAKNVKLINQRVYNDGKISRQYENGKTELTFSNGVKKETFQDGYTVIYFNNQDIKQNYPDGKIVYYFAEAKTTQTTFPDGLQVFKFASGQIEKHYPDGTKEISFPDGTLKCIFADGEEESIFADGTVQRVEKNGIKAIEYPNGEKEITFPDGTLIKEFPDGRIRKTFPDGTYENTFVERQIEA